MGAAGFTAAAAHNKISDVARRVAERVAPYITGLALRRAPTPQHLLTLSARTSIADNIWFA